VFFMTPLRRSFINLSCLVSPTLNSLFLKKNPLLIFVLDLLKYYTIFKSLLQTDYKKSEIFKF